MTQRSTTRMPQLTGVDRVTELVPGVSARGVRGVVLEAEVGIEPAYADLQSAA